MIMRTEEYAYTYARDVSSAGPLYWARDFSLPPRLYGEQSLTLPLSQLSKVRDCTVPHYANLPVPAVSETLRLCVEKSPTLPLSHQKYGVIPARRVRVYSPPPI